MSKSNHAEILDDIAASLVLMPGDPLEIFMRAAENVRDRLLKQGYETDYIIEQLVYLGARHDELRDRMSDPPPGVQ